MNGASLLAEAQQALRQAHQRLLDPTAQGIDCARAAFLTTAERLSELRSVLGESPESGQELLPAMMSLRDELNTVSLLLQSAALHRSRMMQRMLQAESAATA